MPIIYQLDMEGIDLSYELEVFSVTQNNENCGYNQREDVWISWPNSSNKHNLTILPKFLKLNTDP